MEKINCRDQVRNGGVLHRDKEDRNIIYKIEKMKGTWIGHILCRNCLLEQVSEGKDIEKNRSDGKTRK
jgi:hypothetical protein